MIEEKIINKLLSDKEFFSIAKDVILANPKIFEENDNYTIIKTIKHFVEEKKINPTFDDILLFIENDTDIKESEFVSITQFLEKEKEKTYDITVDILKEEVLKWVKGKLTMNLMLKTAEFLTGRNKKSTLETIQIEMAKINNIEFDDDLGIFLEDTYIFKEYDIDRVLLGFEPVDDLYGGGVPKATFNVILAGPHVGKSQTMMFLACCSAILGINVTYISGEMRTNMTRQRIDSVFLKLSTLVLNEKNLGYKRYLAMWKKIKKKIHGNINIKYFPSSTANANNIGKYIEDLRNKKSYDTGLLVLDSLNLMRPIDTRITKIQKHIWMEAITIDFREMIDVMNISLITAAQINREGMKLIQEGHDIDMTVIGEFFMLGGFADSILGLKGMYVDDGLVYNDKRLEKPTKESMNDKFDISDYGKKYSRVVKMNVIKSRFGIRVGSYIFLGSDENTSSLIDINMNTKLNIQKLPDIDIDEIYEAIDDEKTKFIEKNEDDSYVTFRNKRKKIGR